MNLDNRQVILLAYGGSIAYGTNIETSDVDTRGICLNTVDELIGLDSMNQLEDKEEDTVIYSFNKVIKLLMNVNPNVIEMLGCKPEHYLTLDKYGKMLLDNSDLFLSQRAVNSFGGYANSQLRRLQNALARDQYPQSEKEVHILNSITNQMTHINENYNEGHGINLYIDKSNKDDFEEEIYMNINTTHYPLRDFKAIYSEMHNVVKDYNKLNHRNKKKDNIHLCKHAMHLVRLFMMGSEILEGKGINTYRENDRELLLSIRNGFYQNDDTTFNSSFWDLVNEYENKFKYARDNTNLPSKPNRNKINELVVEINKGVILSEN